MIIKTEKTKLDGRLPQIREDQDTIDQFRNECFKAGTDVSKVVRAFVRGVASGKITIKDLQD